LGELDHPDSAVVNLQNVSHNITEMYWDDDKLMGVVEVLSTPSGNILRELFKSNIRLGISSSGLGSVKSLSEAEGTVEVQDDFSLLAFDFVSNPSTRGAFMNPVALAEGVGKKLSITINKYSKVENLIHEILSEIK
jgi:hypothetical protein